MFRVTYEIVTPESAAKGDYAECGFLLPGERKVPTTTVGMRLREFRALHPPAGITPSSLARVSRLLGL